MGRAKDETRRDFILRPKRKYAHVYVSDEPNVFYTQVAKKCKVRAVVRILHGTSALEAIFTLFRYF